MTSEQKLEIIKTILSKAPASDDFFCGIVAAVLAVIDY